MALANIAVESMDIVSSSIAWRQQKQIEERSRKP